MLTLPCAFDRRMKATAIVGCLKEVVGLLDATTIGMLVNCIAARAQKQEISQGTFIKVRFLGGKLIASR